MNNPRTTSTNGSHAEQILKDNARRPLRSFLFWGIPILGLIAANLLTAIPMLAAIMVITSYAWIGTACLVNATQCGRVHCWFTGPWCLGLAALLFAYVFIRFRPFGWSFSDIANYGGLVALFLWFTPELVFGKYFKRVSHG